MASINDKITDTRLTVRPVSTTASGTRAAGGTSLACASLTGWPTASKVHFVTYQIDTQSKVVAGTQLDCSGIVSGNTIGSFTVLDGTDVGNVVGDVVEMLPTASWGQDLSDALLTSLDRTGAIKSGATITSPTLVTPALGTPVSGVATNLTGTAAGLTAGNVTTNANLTGPVTSVGNATSIAAGAISNAMLANSAVANLSGTNTGDQTNISGNAATVTTNANLTGDVTSSGNATTIAADAVTPAKMINGLVKGRQGNTTGAASWIDAGTSNTDVSGTTAFIQVGVVTALGSGDVTVTYPTAFNYAPIVIVSMASANSFNCFPIAVSIAASSFNVRAIDPISGARKQEVVAWIAIGQ